MKGFLICEVKGITVTKLDNGKWMSDIIFSASTKAIDGRRVYSSAPGNRGEYNYKELRSYLREIYGIELPNQVDLIYVGKNGAGKVYTTPTNTYLGEDLLNNTYRFIR